ncbi:hypothetical protein BDV28DRAFT_132280 [Aspergillus coremiiformis]|uniref:Secreted protein n=1 Tax=Aspergillus coremiiformis TaxID=138285 RepID=A0A5N6Z8A4_9EURO|nr:hypothetical protein BDV28DRAFT_132280 [Aspergillus coremiiformis]
MSTMRLPRSLFRWHLLHRLTLGACPTFSRPRLPLRSPRFGCSAFHRSRRRRVHAGRQLVYVHFQIYLRLGRRLERYV